MDFLSPAIDLALWLKARFEMADQNRSDHAALTSEIAESLSQIQDYLNQVTSVPSDGLQNDLAEFENYLRRILGRHEALIKPEGSGFTGSSVNKMKDVYNASDIKQELNELRHKVHTCRQNLQLPCSWRIEAGVATMNQQLIAAREELETIRRQIEILINERIPGLTDTRVPITVEDENDIPDSISAVRISDSLGQESIRRPRNDSKLTLSPRSARNSLKSFSSSLMERKYLKQLLKKLTNELPQLCGQALMKKTIPWLNPYRGLAVWEKQTLSSPSRGGSIRETHRILDILQSGKKISYVDAARSLLRLARELENLGMQEESCKIYDWGVQICCELAANGSMRTLRNFVIFLYKLFLDLGSRGRFDDAQRVLKQAVKVRHQLLEGKKKTYLVKLATSLENVVLYLKMLERHDAAVVALQEVVDIRHHLVKTDRDRDELSSTLNILALDLYDAGCYQDALIAGERVTEIVRGLVENEGGFHYASLARSLSHLAVYLASLGRDEEAIRAREELVEIHRELAKSKREIYFPVLAWSLRALAVDLDRLGRHVDAGKAEEEAVEIRRELGKINEETYRPLLVQSLRSAEGYLYNAGQYEDAAKTGLEALTICRELVRRHGETYLPLLGLSLQDLAVVLITLRRYQDAVKIRDEVIQELMKNNKDIHLTPFTETLQILERSGLYSGGKVVNIYQKPTAIGRFPPEEVTEDFQVPQCEIQGRSLDPLLRIPCVASFVP